MTTNKRPVQEYRAGNIKASIWRNEQPSDGQTVVRFSVKIQKRFFDRATQQWSDTDCLFADDLPRLRLVAEKAFEFILVGNDSNEIREAD